MNRRTVSFTNTNLKNYFGYTIPRSLTVIQTTHTLLCWWFVAIKIFDHLVLHVKALTHQVDSKSPSHACLPSGHLCGVQIVSCLRANNWSVSASISHWTNCDAFDYAKRINSTSSSISTAFATDKCTSIFAYASIYIYNAFTSCKLYSSGFGWCEKVSGRFKCGLQITTKSSFKRLNPLMQSLLWGLLYAFCATFKGSGFVYIQVDICCLVLCCLFYESELILRHIASI